MKKIYNSYLEYAFWINTLIFLIIFSFIPINDINPTESKNSSSIYPDDNHDVNSINC